VGSWPSPRRTLSDGRGYEIVKNAAVARDVSWTGLDYFWLATCVLR